MIEMPSFLGSPVEPTRPPESTFNEARRAFAPSIGSDRRPLIEYHGVTKRFSDYVAIKRIDLSIFQNEFFSLLGLSGCGKTTLMRMLAGFETPTEGIVRLGGEDITRVPPHKRPVNMMFQNYTLFPHLDVSANISFGLRREGLKRNEINARMRRLLCLK